jgi:aspartyl-tRNA(Asn)/glutamyl-tRNA(Gln) amidotransferase subunit A
MPEYGWFAMTNSPLFGITRNPWNPQRTPGGSSGGAVATLAAGIGALAFGNDGGGSVRLPACWSGVYGLKPTFGRVPHYPQEGPFCINIAGGPLTRSVADAALMLNEMAKPDIRDWYALPYDGRDYLAGLDDGVKGLKIAYSPNLGEAEVEDQVAQPVAEAVDVFRDLGAEVTDVGPVFGPVRERFEKLYLAGAGNFLRSIPEDQYHLMDPRTLALGRRGLEVTLEECLAAMSERAVFGEEMQRFHADWDLLLTPTMPTTAPPVDAIDYDRWQVVPFTYPFNVTMQPAASIPCGVAPDGLPVGLQIVGPKFAEHAILKASRAFEAARPWPWPHPVLAASLANIEPVITQ